MKKRIIAISVLVICCLAALIFAKPFGVEKTPAEDWLSEQGIDDATITVEDQVLTAELDSKGSGTST